VSQPERQITDECVQRLLLARLFVKVKKPLSENEVLRRVAEAIAPPLSEAVAAAAARRALEQCIEASYVMQHSSTSKLILTPEGQQRITDMLGLKAQRALSRWDRAQRLVALSLTGRAGAPGKRLDAEQLAADILATQQGLPSTAGATLVQMVDRMAWRALGVETDKPFSTSAVQRYLLRALVPEDVRVDRAIWRRMLAMRAIGADGHTVDALTRALLCREIETAKTDNIPASAAVSVRNDNAGAQSSSLADFAHAVGAAARGPTVRRFHEDRAFIASVWEHMRGQSPIGEMSLDDFKRRLISAHQQGLLRIVGADLVAAMDPQDVQRSEARLKGATFHFVEVTAGGAR
jgi:hypothetical protein